MNEYRRFIRLLSGVTLAVLVGGCASFSEYGKLEKSARDAYVRGDYDQAMQLVTRSLKIDPTYDKSQQLVAEVYPLAVSEHLNRITTAKGSEARFRWDVVVKEYEALTRLEQDARALPRMINAATKQPLSFEQHDYSAPLNEAKANAAEDHYQEGKLLFGREGISNRDRAATEFAAANRFLPGYKDASTLAAEGYYQEGLLLARSREVETQKQAAKAFKAAQGYVPGYRDSATLYERSRKAGVKRIAIVPFQDKSGITQYGAVADMIVDTIVGNVMSNPANMEFLDIVSREQLEKAAAEQRLGMSGLVDVNSAVQAGNFLGAHEILTGRITQVSVMHPAVTRKQVREKTSVVVGKKAAKDRKGRDIEEDVYGDVYADVTIYTLTAGASIAGSYQVIDVRTSKVQDTQQFSGAYDFKETWATSSGDDRALSKESVNLKNKGEQRAPDGARMVNLAMQNLTTTLSTRLQKYAR